MKIILKPMGAVLLFGSILTLSGILFWNKTHPVMAPATTTVMWPVVADAKPVHLMAGDTVFDDDIATGWQDQSWVQDRHFDETKTVYSGKTAIRVRFNPYDGIKFYNPDLKPNAYDRVTFFIHGGEQGMQLAAVNGNQHGGKMLGHHVQFTVPKGKWSLVVIPLKELNNGTVPDIESFWIQSFDTSAKPEVFIDSVHLLKPSDPSLSEPALPYQVVAETEQKK